MDDLYTVVFKNICVLNRFGRSDLCNHALHIVVGLGIVFPGQDGVFDRVHGDGVNCLPADFHVVDRIKDRFLGNKAEINENRQTYPQHYEEEFPDLPKKTTQHSRTSLFRSRPSLIQVYRLSEKISHSCKAETVE